MTAATLPDLSAARAQLEALMANLFATAVSSARAIAQKLREGLDTLNRAFERASEGLRKLLGLPSLADHLRRLTWTGIARRHALRPPARGYWVRRCFCLACRERRGLA